MRSSELLAGAALGAILLSSSGAAHAQAAAPGFAIERFQPVAPGGAWFVMDSLDIHGDFTGGMSTTVGYERDPLRIGSLSVVHERALADFAFAAEYDRYRFSVAFEMPLVTRGTSGGARGVIYQGPNFDPGSRPDLLSDARLGLDVRLVGKAHGAFRAGVSGQLFVPNGTREDYVTDDTYRAMFRVLAAGDYLALTWAAHAGVHVRPRDESDVPGAPRGSELLLGAAAGARFDLDDDAVMTIGPELFGATAFSPILASRATALEVLFGGRVEGHVGERTILRGKLGVGGGLDAQFGAPAWRTLLSVEVVGHAK